MELSPRAARACLVAGCAIETVPLSKERAGAHSELSLCVLKLAITLIHNTTQHITSSSNSIDTGKRFPSGCHDGRNRGLPFFEGHTCDHLLTHSKMGSSLGELWASVVQL